MKTTVKIFSVIFFSLICVCSFSQTKEQLEQQRKKLIKEIEETNKFLQKTAKNKQTTLKDLKAITSQVDSRKKLITTISSELKASDKKIADNNKKIDSLHKNLVNLNRQFAELQRYTYLRELSSNKLSYLLSSENINTFFLRWRYIKQFEAFSDNKKQEIVRLAKEIENSTLEITKIKNEKGVLLNQEKKEAVVLEQEKAKKDKMLKDISTKETILKSDLQKQKKEREKLNAAIEKVIAEQLRMVREKSEVASKKSGSGKEKSFDVETEKLSNEFAKNKNKLPWPVSSGFVSSKFGIHKDDVLKGIEVNNNGIDISGKGSKDVRAVFGGKVEGAVKIPGSTKYMVVVSHGNYFTVYANLDEVSVRKGSNVSIQETIGRTSADKNGDSEIHFEIWKEKTKLNPESWLK